MYWQIILIFKVVHTGFMPLSKKSRALYRYGFQITQGEEINT